MISKKQTGDIMKNFLISLSLLLTVNQVFASVTQQCIQAMNHQTKKNIHLVIHVSSQLTGVTDAFQVQKSFDNIDECIGSIGSVDYSDLQDKADNGKSSIECFVRSKFDRLVYLTTATYDSKDTLINLVPMREFVGDTAEESLGYCLSWQKNNGEHP